MINTAKVGFKESQGAMSNVQVVCITEGGQKNLGQRGNTVLLTSSWLAKQGYYAYLEAQT